MSYLKKRLLISALMGFGAYTVTAEAHRPATLEELNGMADLENCSGSFVSIGREGSAQGLILSAGHCPSYPGLYKPGKAEAGRDYSKEPPAKSFPPGSTLAKPLNYPIGHLYYGTMTNVDVSLYELTASLTKLENQKIKIREFADHLPQPGMTFQITSGFWKETQSCEVESILLDSEAERRAVGSELDTPHLFRNSILFKPPCYARSGWSGSPVYDLETNLIYGVLSRVYELESAGTLTRFAEFITKKWNPFNPEVDTEVRVVASNILDLKDCLTSDGLLDTDRATCDLPKPTPKPSSSWPRPNFRH